MAMFDTDVLIWVQRGSEKAAALVEKTEERCISVITLMELLQGALGKTQHRYVKEFLEKYDFRVLPLGENIGYRASIYIEEYALGHGLRVADALIAATAVEHNEALLSSNKKHYQIITELNLTVFKPA